MEYFEKQLRKGVYGEDKYKDTFQNPTALYEEEDYKKLLEFKKYCFELQKCMNCGTKYSGARKEKDTYNLILECENCLSNDILADPISQAYVKWLDETQHKTVDISFEEGFPSVPDFDVNFAGVKKVTKIKHNINVRKKDFKGQDEV